jgi:predicted transposase YbfD/YdcC
VINPRLRQEIISIDGKTVRHSYDTAEEKSAIHVVSAWANKAGLTLGQIKVDEKSNEITAILELLESLDVEGSIVTIDAVGTQKSIAETIRDRGADYVLALKGNQGTLQEDVELYFQGVSQKELGQMPFRHSRTFDKDHGRREAREYFVSDDIGWLSMKKDWKGLTTLSMVRSQRTVGEQSTSENRYYISSLPVDAKALAQTIRGHWAIENSLHWVLDVAFREHESRKWTRPGRVERRSGSRSGGTAGRRRSRMLRSKRSRRSARTPSKCYRMTWSSGTPPGTMRSEQWCRDCFEEAMAAVKVGKNTGIDARAHRLTPQLFRHTINTQLLDESVDAEKIRATLGWTNMATQKGHTHFKAEHLREPARVVDRFLCVKSEG